MIDDDFYEDDTVAIKLIMPAVFVDEYTTVYKVNGNQPFELRNKMPIYSKVEGVSISLNNETNIPVKFLIARTIDIIPYINPVRVEYTNWNEGVYQLFEKLSNIEAHLEENKISDDLANSKISLLVPLEFIDNGQLVSPEKGSKLYKVHKATKSNNKSKIKNIKAELILDKVGQRTIEFPENTVLLINEDNVLLKTNSDFIKIERSLDDIGDLISFLSDFIDEIESK